MEVATENGGLAILSGTPAAVGGRGPRLGFAAATTTTTTTAAAWPPTGVTGREQPSPGAQASAEQWEADEREKIPRRGVGDAHLELIQTQVVHAGMPQVPAGEGPPWGAREGRAAEGQQGGARVVEDP
jgi:hypothetical protein